jgi:hypothetical protein
MNAGWCGEEEYKAKEEEREKRGREREIKVVTQDHKQRANGKRWLQVKSR